jgi:hypothetical protein
MAIWKHEGHLESLSKREPNLNSEFATSVNNLGTSL